MCLVATTSTTVSKRIMNFFCIAKILAREPLQVMKRFHGRDIYFLLSFSCSSQSDRKLKNAFELYKNIDHFYMLNAVPDCHLKTPKKYRNETLYRILINTITRDAFSDQLSTAEMDKSNVFKSQVKSDLNWLDLTWTWWIFYLTCPPLHRT